MPAPSPIQERRSRTSLHPDMMTERVEVVHYDYEQEVRGRRKRPAYNQEVWAWVRQDGYPETTEAGGVRYQDQVALFGLLDDREGLYDPAEIRPDDDIIWDGRRWTVEGAQRGWINGFVINARSIGRA